VRRWLLRNPEAADVIPQLRWFVERGIAFHTQVVLVPGINDGPQLVRTLSDLYGLGPGVLSVSVVPVALTEFSKHALVRQPTRGECRAALATVGDFAARAVADRGAPWCYGADDLYLQADVPLPPAAWYGDFEQRENGVGAVRYLQTRIQAAHAALEMEAWRDKRIGIVTGTAMGPLLPQVAADLTAATGAHFEILALENTVFGPSVTTAGLLPGKAVLAALRDRTDLDLALLPAESVNDDLLFMDDLEAHDLAAQLPMPVRLSYDFADALVGEGVPA
jgi:NifB/MoaA-like Fe-S oxidoreductase